MGNVIPMLQAGCPLETLYKAAEECKENEGLKAIVILQGEDPDDIRVSYSSSCNSVDVHWALTKAALWQMADGE